MILLRSAKTRIFVALTTLKNTQRRLLSTLLHEWSVLVLGVLLIGNLTYTFERAGWVSDSGPIITVIFMGWFFGLLLAYSRYSNRFSLFYSAVISIVVTCNEVGQIAPSIFTWMREPFWETVNTLHLRLVTFLLRVSGWIDLIRRGESIQDTGLFVLILGLLGWISLSWLAWWVVRRHQALPGLIPIAFLMAVNLHLSRQMRSTLAVFLVFGLLLIARSAYTNRRADWQRRHVDFPEDITIDWGGSAALAATLIAIFALLTPFIGTKEGWQALSKWVQRSRTEMAERADQLFGGVNPPPSAPDEELVEVIPSIALPDLNDIGRPPPNGNETVFWVKVDDPAPPSLELRQGPPPELLPQVPQHYWRSQIYSIYTGRGWESAPPGELLTGVPLPDEFPAELPSSGRYRLLQEFEIRALHSGALFAVNQPVAVSKNYALRTKAEDNSALVEGKGQFYQAISMATRVTITELDAAVVEYPQTIRTNYLQLPAELPARVRQLAREITAGSTTPYQKVSRLQEYLRLNYTYDLKTPMAPPGRDVVDFFLFDSGRGYCSHYASAMVVMLRTLGVPARTVTGYAMGIYDEGRGMYRVPASYSHAWVEVYFPGYDWVEFEPTTAYSPFTFLPGEAPLSASLNNPNSPVLRMGGQQARWLWLALPVLLLVGAWGLYYWSRLQRQRSFDTARMSIQLYWRIRQRLTWGGLASASNLTPDEFLETGLENLAAYPQLVNALKQATRLYCRAEYSPHMPALADVRRAEYAWQQAGREWLRLFIKK